MSRRSILLKSVSIAASWLMIVWWFVLTLRIGLSVGQILTIIVIDVLFGCSLTTLIILLNRQNVGCAAKTGIITLLTTFFFATIGGPCLVPTVYGYDHGFGETPRCMLVAGLVGVFVGFLLSVWNSRPRSPSPTRHRSR
jgi:hypothetical protein